MSKRRLRWRFGFPNQEALTAGKSGSDCRGEEHDVTLTWSVASGKRIIMANSRQIYCNTVKSSVFEYSWVTEKNHNIRLCVYSTAPGNGERQYELSVDGISFYKMPKIFEVGLKGTLDDRVPGVITNIDRSKLLENSNIRSGGYDYSISGRTLVPKNEQEEQEELKRAIAASLQESRDFLVTKGRGETDVMLKAATEPQSQPKQQEPLIDLLSDSAPIPVQAQGNQLAAPLDFGTNQVGGFAQSTFPSTNNVVAPVFDEFQPRAPTYHDISNQIMGNYPMGQNPAPTQSTTQAHNTSYSTQMYSNMVDSRPQTASSNPFDDQNSGQFGSQY